MQTFTRACFDALKELKTLLEQTEHSVGAASHDRGAGGDVSIGYDLLAETCFVKHLASFGQICSEESGEIGEGEDRIIIDPIDGSDNLKSNFPYYGASIALEANGKVTIGIVCNLADGDCFVRDDNGHYRYSLFDKQLQERIVINEYAKVGLFEKAGEHLDVAQKLIDYRLKFRSPGAVALSLAYAHSVKYVLFLGNIRTYDVAAGLYLCEDLYTYVGEDIFIVSHNKDVFAKILTIFNLTDNIS